MLSALIGLGAFASGCSEGEPSTLRGERGEERSAADEDEVAPSPSAAEVEAPAEPPQPAARTVTIGAGGDVLLHLKVVRSAEEHASEGGFVHVFSELGEIIDASEVAFANLETPLSTRIDPESGDPPVLGAPASAAEGLAAAGIDVVSVANNHSYDQTSDGMKDTLAALESAGVEAVGAAVEEARAAGPTVIERGALRVAFVAFTERINRGPAVRGEPVYVARYDDEAAGAALAAARAEADVVVASIHWSHDFRTRPFDGQRERARAMIDAGADLIVGHGPHVLQEVERLPSPRGEAVVAYSLGNLVSNQALRYRPGRPVPEGVHPAVVLPTLRDGAWLRVRFALDDERVQVQAVEAVPLWTHNNYLLVARGQQERLDIRVQPLARVEEAVRLERRAAISDALGPSVTLTDGPARTRTRRTPPGAAAPGAPAPGGAAPGAPAPGGAAAGGAAPGGAAAGGAAPGASAPGGAAAGGAAPGAPAPGGAAPGGAAPGGAAPGGAAPGAPAPGAPAPGGAAPGGAAAGGAAPGAPAPGGSAPGGSAPGVPPPAR